MSAWSEVAPGVRVRQSRCEAMNSVLAELEGHVLLVDPGVMPSELDELAAATQAVTPSFDRVSVAFTHPHWDHVLGLPWFPGAETFAHSGFGDRVEAEEARIAADADEWIRDHGERMRAPFRAFDPLLKARGTTLVRLGPFEVVTQDTPGHDANHLALWLPRQGVLVAGDLLSDLEAPWLDGPPWVYRASLKQLHWLYEQEDVRVLVPGHGPVAHGRIEGYRRLLRDLDYLLVLEQRVRDGRERGLTLTEVQTGLATMDYTGRDTNPVMPAVHADNVRFTWDALAEA
jgi:glyoxylase-like metal-dependent hydrolase (beta-lactamase superfamily II)